MKKNEANLMREIQKTYSRRMSRLFRNNVGMAYSKLGVPIHFGLCKGSADLIGWRGMKITQDMVGKTFAQFVSVEVKNGTSPSPDQIAWKDIVQACGGMAVIVTSIDDLKGEL